MGKGRMKGKMRRGYMKRFASDNIQVKGSTRAKANMPQRRLYTGTIKAPNEWLEAKFVGKSISEIELQLRGLGSNPVPRGEVLLRLRKFQNEVVPSRHKVLFQSEKRVDKLYFNDEGTCYFIIREHTKLQFAQKSCTYGSLQRAERAYALADVEWRHKLTLQDFVSGLATRSQDP